MDITQLKNIIEAAILAFEEPLSLKRLATLFNSDEQPKKEELLYAISALTKDCEQRGIELKQLASGYCFQTKLNLLPWIKRLWPEKQVRHSRAFMETLAIIAYRQPITRAEIESIRGVSISSHIIKTLFEYEWIHVVGQREVPGKPSLLGTTKKFLDHLGLQSLADLPEVNSTALANNNENNL